MTSDVDVTVSGGPLASLAVDVWLRHRHVHRRVHHHPGRHRCRQGRQHRAETEADCAVEAEGDDVDCADDDGRPSTDDLPQNPDIEIVKSSVPGLV